MTQLFGLAIFTKKEVMQLLVDEKRNSYRRGYKAGNALLHRWEKKNLKPEVSAQVTDENGIPSVYGDSLPVKPMPEVVVHTDAVELDNT